MLEKLREIIRSRRDEMVKLAAELVSIPTENPPGRSYRDCLDRLRERLGALGLPAKVEPVVQEEGGDDAHPRFWLRSRFGEGNPTVVFHGHVDVVPAQNPAQFSPQISEDTLFGRGSSDMKGGLVSMIYAMWALAESGFSPRGGIALHVVPDEETGGRLGSQVLSRQGLLFENDPIAMFTAEPTGGIVWNASRGAITGRVKVKGRSSHVGLQYRGVNAFENMLRVANALRDLKEEVERRRTRFPIDPEAAGRSILMMGGEGGGGSSFNLVPDQWTFTIDRRINPEEDFDEEKTRLLEVVDTVRARGVDVEVDLFQEARSAGIAADHPVARTLASAVERVTGEKARLELCPGILEIRFYAERDIPAFAYGPGLLTVSHGPKEFLKRKDMEDCAVVYALTAAELLRPEAE